MKTRKPAKPPVIDLGGRLAVIDDKGAKPVWRTICRVSPASKVAAHREMKSRGIQSAWLIDDLGYKEFLTLNN